MDQADQAAEPEHIEPMAQECYDAIGPKVSHGPRLIEWEIVTRLAEYYEQRFMSLEEN